MKNTTQWQQTLIEKVHTTINTLDNGNTENIKEDFTYFTVGSDESEEVAELFWRDLARYENNNNNNNNNNNTNEEFNTFDSTPQIERRIFMYPNRLFLRINRIVFKINMHMAMNIDRAKA